MLIVELEYDVALGDIDEIPEGTVEKQISSYKKRQIKLTQIAVKLKISLIRP